MRFQNKCLLSASIIACASLLFLSCNEAGYVSPHHYDFSQPQRSQLGKVLNEISGICITPDDKALLAISDSKEKIFQIDLKTRKLKDYSGKVIESNSDLEDLVQVDSSVYLLRSNGELKEVSAGGDSSAVKTYEMPVSGRNDFETLYYDPTAGGLVVICKSCAHEKGQGVRTAYRFDLQTKTFDSTVFFTISKEEVRRLVKNTEAKFDPSAAAIHPINKRLYILSSAGNLLVITDTRGKVIEAHNLNPDDFPQAEGIAFARNGDMYISNEGKSGKPTLLFYPFENGKQKNKQ